MLFVDKFHGQVKIEIKNDRREVLILIFA